MYFTIMVLKIWHAGGFFSCCSIKLDKIVEYYNQCKELPKSLNTDRLFKRYKPRRQKRCITYDYFKHFDHYQINLDNLKGKLDYSHNYQYKDYSTLDYQNLSKVVRKYFSPSNEIEKIIKDIQDKYQLDYDNTCVLFYRGNDKNKETQICGYQEYLSYIDKVLQQNSDP